MPCIFSSMEKLHKDRDKHLQEAFLMIQCNFYSGKEEHGCTQSCPTLCNLINSTLLGFYVHKISQGRILDWVAICFSKGIFLTWGLYPHPLCLLHYQTASLLLCQLGSPMAKYREVSYISCGSQKWFWPYNQ